MPTNGLENTYKMQKKTIVKQAPTTIDFQFNEEISLTDLLEVAEIALSVESIAKDAQTEESQTSVDKNGAEGEGGGRLTERQQFQKAMEESSAMSAKKSEAWSSKKTRAGGKGQKEKPQDEQHDDLDSRGKKRPRSTMGSRPTIGGFILFLLLQKMPFFYVYFVWQKRSHPTIGGRIRFLLFSIVA